MMSVAVLCLIGLVGVIGDCFADPGALVVFAAAFAISLLWPPAR